MENDNILLRQLSEGSEEAFQAWFDKYRPNMYAVSEKFLRSEEKAEEVVSRVFEKAWKNRKSLKHIKDAQRYLFDEAVAEMMNIFKTSH